MCIVSSSLNNTFAFSCTDVCLGDLRPALTDEAGCWVLLLCCANHENENSDVFLWASPGDAHCSAWLSAFSYSEPQRPLAHHHHTGNNLQFPAINLAELYSVKNNSYGWNYLFNTLGRRMMICITLFKQTHYKQRHFNWIFWHSFVFLCFHPSSPWLLLILHCRWHHGKAVFTPS